MEDLRVEDQHQDRGDARDEDQESAEDFLLEG